MDILHQFTQGISMIQMQINSFFQTVAHPQALYIPLLNQGIRFFQETLRQLTGFFLGLRWQILSFFDQMQMMILQLPPVRIITSLLKH